MRRQDLSRSYHRDGWLRFLPTLGPEFKFSHSVKGKTSGKKYTKMVNDLGAKQI